MHTLVDQHLRRRSLILAWMVMASGALAALPSRVVAQAAQSGTIVGRITDARTGDPIQSASIQIEATRLGGITSPDGRFRIANVPAGARTVVVLRLGYASARRAVTVTAGQEASVELALQASAVSLDQVVVTGTAGEAEKKSIGNAVSTIGWERRHNARLAGRERGAFVALMAELHLPKPKMIDIAVPANQLLGIPHAV